MKWVSNLNESYVTSSDVVKLKFWKRKKISIFISSYKINQVLLKKTNR